MLTSPAPAHITSCPHILPIVQPSEQRNQTLFPGHTIVPYLVIRTTVQMMSTFRWPPVLLLTIVSYHHII